MAVVLHSLFTDYDVYLFKKGKHTKLYQKFGAHPMTLEDKPGCYFAVFAPVALKVNVIGSFNDWDIDADPLFVRWDKSGIWEGFIPGVSEGDMYKFHITGPDAVTTYDKADPFAQHTETPPLNGSKVWEVHYQWNDKAWLQKRMTKNTLDAPCSIYEVHLGSWMKNDDGAPFSYEQMAEKLVPYVKEMGFTHVEFLPIMEHPYDPSWGYQVTGYFAPTSRFGTPQMFKALVDAFHEASIGVILDWVPAHFPTDAHGLGYFDGSYVYEHPDVRKGFHPDWKSLIFNFERNEIRSFLISSALFWLEEYHIDGLRVDAVASMIYLDYSRNEGEWEKNIHGNNEYLAAISLLQEVNTALYTDFKGVQSMAEESTAFPGVTLPVHNGGLGFGQKWMMGWMHDTLSYFKNPPIYRKYHHNNITFSIVYAFSENFLLPFSHDEVVHGKAPLIYKMPGDDREKFANLRAMYGYMFTHPGSKLLFMGNEFAQTAEWDFGGQLMWNLLQYDSHKGMLRLVKDLNHLYTTELALFKYQFDQKGFEWLDFSDHENAIIVYIRKTDDIDDSLVVLCNFDNQVHRHYQIGVPRSGKWTVIMNTDDTTYWGSGICQETTYQSERKAKHGRASSITLMVPPLAVLVLKQV